MRHGRKCPIELVKRKYPIYPFAPWIALKVI